MSKKKLLKKAIKTKDKYQEKEKKLNKKMDEKLVEIYRKHRIEIDKVEAECKRKYAIEVDRVGAEYEKKFSEVEEKYEQKYLQAVTEEKKEVTENNNANKHLEAIIMEMNKRRIPITIFSMGLYSIQYLVYIFLALYRDENGQVRISKEGIRDLCGIKSNAIVERALKGLIENRLIFTGKEKDMYIIPDPVEIAPYVNISPLIEVEVFYQNNVRPAGF